MQTQIKSTKLTKNRLSQNQIKNRTKMNPLYWIESNEPLLYKIALGIVLMYSAFGWLALTGIKLNYGRLSNSLMNVYLNPKWAWFLFEIPNLLWALYFILYKGQVISHGFCLFIIHYINRDILYPLSLKTTTKVPFQIAFNAFIFTLGNGFLQGSINQANLKSAQPIRQAIGTFIFAAGMMINIRSDKILQIAKQKSLKDAKQEQNGPKNEGKSNKKHYKKIDEFLFKYISNPNYLGEIIEWIGYGIACWKLEGFLFAFSTFNVLVPAAIVRNKWNHENIAEYPSDRKAIIPFIL